MVYAPHLELTASGTIGPSGAAQEIFSFGISLGLPDGGAVGLGDQAAFDAMVAATADYFNSVDTRIHNTTRMTRLRLSVVGPDGRTLKDGGGAFVQRIHDYVSPGIAGGTASTMHPMQCSLAVSLMTARAGRSGRGRFYTPTPAIALDADFRMPAIAASAAADAAREWIAAVNTASAPSGIVAVVASRSGFNTPINAIRVGRVIDTIRRRRNGLDEAYASVAL